MCVAAECWYNRSFHSTIGITPFEALYNFTTLLHIPYYPKETSNKDVDLLRRDIEENVVILKFFLARAQNRMK